MKLIEYKPHDIWFIWIHPCYLVETTKDKGGGVMEIVGRYYYGRTHLTMDYFKREMLDRLIRRGGNFPSTRQLVGLSTLAQDLNDPDANVSTMFPNIHITPRRTGKTWAHEHIAEWLKHTNKQGMIINGIEDNPKPVKFPMFMDIWEEKPNSITAWSPLPKPTVFYPYSIPRDLIADIKELLHNYDTLLKISHEDTSTQQQEKLSQTLKQLNDLK